MQPILANLALLISLHTAPAQHFAEFAPVLQEKGFKTSFLATDVSARVLHAKGIFFEEINPNKIELSYHSKEVTDLANTIALTHNKASHVLIDINHPFDKEILRAFKEKAPQVTRIAYYDNPDETVPGGYSEIAAKVLPLAHIVLFANFHLADVKIAANASASAHINLSEQKRIGLGYYPFKGAQELREKREQRQTQNQDIAVYLGANHDIYFEKAFLAFLQMLHECVGEFANTTFLIQQHPGAKEKNKEQELIDKYIQENKALPDISISSLTTEEALTVCDVAYYFQTSMSTTLVLAGIPAIQIGHESLVDQVVRSGLVQSATSKKSLKSALAQLSKGYPEPSSLYQILGICTDWPSQLKNVFSTPTT